MFRDVGLSFFDETKEAVAKRFNELNAHRAANRCISNLGKVDRVEILRLSDDGPLGGTDTFIVPLYEPRAMRINKKALLSDADAEAFADLWRTASWSYSHDYCCHKPHHVVRFFSANESLCDIVLCFSCDDVAIPVWFGHDLVNFLPFDAPNLAIEARINSLVGAAAAQ